MRRNRRTVAYISLTLAGCSGQTTDELKVDDLDGSMGQVQSDGSIVDASGSPDDAATDGEIGPMSDASEMDANTDSASDASTSDAAPPDAGSDAGEPDAATADAGDAGDGPCGAKFTCEDIAFSMSRWSNYEFILQFPNGLPFKSATVSGTVDNDAQCGSPESFSATPNFDVEVDQLSFAVPGLCPVYVCGGFTVTITDTCDRTYDIPITQLVVDNCEGSDLDIQGSCGT